MHELLPSVPTADLSHYTTVSDSENPPPVQPDLTYTVDKAVNYIGLGRFQYALLLLTGLCWTAESMEMLLLSFIKAPLQCAWAISDPRAAFITTSVGIGMLTGATFWGLLGDRYGRRIAFIASTFVTFFFGLLSSISFNYTMLVFSRGAVGFGIGGVPVSFSLLMEFLPERTRGTWGMGICAFWSLGAIFESIVAMHVVPSLGWRWLIAISSAPLGIVLFLSLWLLESPRWCMSKHDVPAALRILEHVALVNKTTLPPGRLVEVTDVPSSEGHVVDSTEDNARLDDIGFDESKPRTALSELLRPGVRSLTTKIWFLWFVVAFVYYGLVMLQPEVIRNENTGKRCSYAASECGSLQGNACKENDICALGSGEGASCTPLGGIAPETGVNAACKSQLTRADYWSTLWASVGEFPGVLASFAVIDRIGRRPLMGYSFGITAITFVFFFGCLGRKLETVAFFVARGASSGSFQTIYLYTTEIYPAQVRASAMGISSSMSRVGLILTPFVAQYLENHNHEAAVLCYFITSALAVFVVWLIPIETTRRPLFSSMDELIRVLKGKVDDMAEAVTFSKDPSVSTLLRLFRWNAKVDGYVRRHESG